MINSPGIWLCKVLVKGSDLAHWISLEVKEVSPCSSMWKQYETITYKNNAPPYICFIPKCTPTNTGMSVTYDGDWIFKVYKNWSFGTKEEFLNYGYFGNCWIEEATKL